MRKYALAFAMLVFGFGFIMADEFTATITKVDGDNVTYQKYKKGEKGKKGEKDGDPVTLPAKGAKVQEATNAGKGKYDYGDEVKGGLGSEALKGATAEKGVQARITTSDDNKSITKIGVIKKKA